MFAKKTIKNIDLKDKTVLLRTDYNVPEKHGKIIDDYRIEQSLPTIQSLQEQNCKVVVISHIGRPEGKEVPELSLQPIADRLGALLSEEVGFAPACTGRVARQAIADTPEGGVVVLENLRFHAGEEANSPQFAHELAELADVFVQDGFGVVHRAHASTEAITHYLPAVAGLLLETEVSTLQRAVQHPRRPLLTIIGGLKLETKVDLLDRFIDIADVLAVGGAMANTILAAQGHKIGRSIFDKNELGHAKRILAECAAKQTRLILPDLDVGVATEIDPGSPRHNITLSDIQHDQLILDYGPQSIKQVLQAVTAARTVIWNGPLGMIELPEFCWASERLAQAMAEEDDDTIVGGGDTAGFIDKLGLMTDFTHVSTGGGAALELMAGKPLPGVEALLDKS